MKTTRQTAGIYIHIPFCQTKCMYCDFYSVADRNDEIPNFINAISKEINFFFESNKYPWIFDTIFFGGGTPSLLNASSIESILKTLDNYVNLNDINEFTIETNPEEITLERLKDFISIGANRLSLGFQTFDKNLLKFLGRLHTPEDCIKTYNNARLAGFDNINTDLIFDIPNQSMNRWKKDLQQLVSLDPEHISTYSLTVEEQTQLFELVKSGEVVMPNKKTDISMYIYMLNFLKENNYIQYEISSHSKKNFRCQHNLHYWRLEPYLAFGPGAHGFDGKKRWWNKKSLDYYLNCLDKNNLPIENEELLTNKNSFNENIMNGLRLTEGVNIDKLEKFLPKGLENYLKPHRKKWPHLNSSGKNFKLKKEGLLFADEIIADLFLV